MQNFQLYFHVPVFYVTLLILSPPTVLYSYVLLIVIDDSLQSVVLAFMYAIHLATLSFSDFLLNFHFIILNLFSLHFAFMSSPKPYFHYPYVSSSICKNFLLSYLAQEYSSTCIRSSHMLFCFLFQCFHDFICEKYFSLLCLIYSVLLCQLLSIFHVCMVPACIPERVSLIVLQIVKHYLCVC